MTDNLSIAVYAFPVRILTLLSVDKFLIPKPIFKQEQQPQCSTCQTPSTIKHVLLE